MVKCKLIPTASLAVLAIWAFCGLVLAQEDPTEERFDSPYISEERIKTIFEAGKIRPPVAYATEKILTNRVFAEDIGVTDAQFDKTRIIADVDSDGHFLGVKQSSSDQDLDLYTFLSIEQIEKIALKFPNEQVSNPMLLLEYGLLNIFGIASLSEKLEPDYVDAQRSYVKEILLSRNELVQTVLDLSQKEGRSGFVKIFGEDYTPGTGGGSYRDALLGLNEMGSRVYFDMPLYHGGVKNFMDKNRRLALALHHSSDATEEEPFSQEGAMRKFLESVKDIYTDDERLELIQVFNQRSFAFDVNFLCSPAIMEKIGIAPKDVLKARALVNKWKKEYTGFEIETAKRHLQPLIDKMPDSERIMMTKVLNNYK